MKKLIFPTVLFSLAAILFSSCSNTTSFAFSKRHYRHGYYVNLRGKQTPTTPVAVTKNHSSVSTPAKVAIASNPQIQAITKPAIIAPEKAVTFNKVTTAKKATIVTNQQITSLNTASPAITESYSATNNIGVSGGLGGDHGNSSSGNVPFWLVVLCAIFIPPLGVYFAYNIGTYFWIDLVLTLLFFFPGMIFALIMVLQK